VEIDTESALLLRAGGRSIHPSQDDIEQIRGSIAVVIEIFELLIQTVTEDRTPAALRRSGNRGTQGLTPADLRDIAKELSDAVAALSREVLCVETLRQIAVDLDRYLTRARRILVVGSGELLPGPVDPAAPDVIAETLVASLSDAEGSFSHLLGLLEEVALKSAVRPSGV